MPEHDQTGLLTAIRQKLAGHGFEAAAIRLALAFKYNPRWRDQPRIPQGNPGGGQWTDSAANQVASLGPFILPVLKEGGKLALRVASQRARPYLMRLPKYWISEELFPSKEDFDFETGRIGLPSNRRPELDLVWYESFAEAKRFLGPAGDGMEWHHIVEQRTAKYGRFPIEFVNSTDNLIALPIEVHRCVTTRMQSRFLRVGPRLRYVVEPQSFSFQFNFGVDLIKICLREYGYDPAAY